MILFSDLEKVEKQWGHEIIFVHTNKYVGKIIYVKRGEKLSFQYHVQKDDVYQGIINLILDGDLSFNKTCEETFRLAPGERHGIEAITDVILFEVSTPELEDVVRIEDNYRRA